MRGLVSTRSKPLTEEQLKQSNCFRQLAVSGPSDYWRRQLTVHTAQKLAMCGGTVGERDKRMNDQTETAVRETLLEGPFLKQNS